MNINLRMQARGLDVLPTTISRFRAGGDEQTAKLLEDIIYPEEVTHCAAGVKWFRYLCLRPGSDDLISNSISHSESHHSGLPEDGTADDKTVRDGRDKPTSSQQVEDEPTSKISQDFNSRVNMTQQVEDGLAKCKLGSNVDKDEAEVIQTFHRMVREYFRGPLKPPFNTEARKAAGFEPAWYEPLAVKEVHVEGDTDN